MTNDQCFLCEKVQNKTNETFYKIANTKVPSSQKTLQTVLQHLARCIQAKLVFQTSISVCADCYDELSCYDTFMLNLLSAQKKLTKRLRKVIMRTLQVEQNTAEELQANDEYKNETEELVSICPASVVNDDDITDLIDDESEHFEVLVEDDMLMDTDILNVDDSDNEAPTQATTISSTAETPKTLSSRPRSMHECGRCDEVFSNKSKVKQHMSDVHNIKIYSCQICGAVRRDEEYLELHMNVHEGKTELECRFCDKRFSRPVNTLRHMRKHWDKKKFQCEKCGERFSLDNMLYNHRLRHEAEDNPLICHICNQTFKSRKTYNHHVLVHREDRPRHYCSMCNKSFTERYTLKMHMKSHTAVVVLSSSPLLKQEADNEEELLGQELVHFDPAIIETEEIVQMDENSEVTFHCAICSIDFIDKELLEDHLQSEHNLILA